MTRIGSIVVGLVILVGGFGLGAAAVQAVSIPDEPGEAVATDPVVAPLSTTSPTPTVEPMPPASDPVPVAPAPQPIDDDDDDDDDDDGGNGDDDGGNGDD